MKKIQWILHNCGNTTEATTLLQQFFKKKTTFLSITLHYVCPVRPSREERNKICSGVHPRGGVCTDTTKFFQINGEDQQSISLLPCRILCYFCGGTGCGHAPHKIKLQNVTCVRNTFLVKSVYESSCGSVYSVVSPLRMCVHDIGRCTLIQCV